MERESLMKAGFFPGQGSQSVGMGQFFYDEFTVFRQTIEEASDTLNINLRKLIHTGPESDLTLTENAQPAIVAVSTGCYRVAELELGLKTGVNLGHSLGEYSALVASEALEFSDAIAWVRARGQAMQAAVPVGVGAMSAIIGAEDAQIEEWCKQVSTPESPVEAANYNAPGQVVVSGKLDAVDRLEKLITEKAIRGVMCKRLNVSAPFHSSLMKPARDVMNKIFETAKKEAKVNELLVPYIPNRTARVTREGGVILPLLSEQVDHAVLWKQSVDHLIDSNVTIAFEFGPGKVLQGLAKRIAKAKGKPFETYPIYDLESLKLAEGAVK